MSARVQRLLAVAAVTAGVGVLGFAAGGLAGTDGQLRAAEAKYRLASLQQDRDHDCPARDAERPPEL